MRAVALTGSGSQANTMVVHHTFAGGVRCGLLSYPFRSLGASLLQRRFDYLVGHSFFGGIREIWFETSLRR